MHCSETSLLQKCNLPWVFWSWFLNKNHEITDLHHDHKALLLVLAGSIITTLSILFDYIVMLLPWTGESYWEIDKYDVKLNLIIRSFRMQTSYFVKFSYLLLIAIIIALLYFFEDIVFDCLVYNAMNYISIYSWL